MSFTSVAMVARKGRAFLPNSRLLFPLGRSTATSISLTPYSTFTARLSQKKGKPPLDPIVEPTMANPQNNSAVESDLYNAFFDDATLSDLTLQLSDRTVRVHRIVLCRKSEYFTKLLTGQFQVCSHKLGMNSDLDRVTDAKNRKTARKKLSSKKMTGTP